MRARSRGCSIDAGFTTADDERAMEPWVHLNARKLLGGLGAHAQVFEVYSAGDSGEGCELILFTTPTSGGLVAWTARVEVRDGRPCTVCTVGW
jgi:hypothetical protein